MCSSILPTQMAIKSSEGGGEGGRGEGVSRAKTIKGKYEAKLEFPEVVGGGAGFKLQALRWGYGYFLE